jgi:[acyl-carrier-protein] S-malonyltransferase
MAPAVGGLIEALDDSDFAQPKFPVVANASAALVDSPDLARRLLADQLTAPVRWVESMQMLAGRWPDARWLELGPGSVLTGLLRKIAPAANCTPLGTAADLEKWLAE